MTEVDPPPVRVEVDGAAVDVAESWVPADSGDSGGRFGLIAFVLAFVAAAGLLWWANGIDRPDRDDATPSPTTLPQPSPTTTIDVVDARFGQWIPFDFEPTQLVAMPTEFGSSDGWFGIAEVDSADGSGAHPVFVTTRDATVWTTPGPVGIAPEVRPLAVGQADGQLLALASRPIPDGGESEIIVYSAQGLDQWEERSRAVVSGFPRRGAFVGEDWIALIDRNSVARSDVTQMRTRFLSGSIESAPLTEITVSPDEFVETWAVDPEGLVAVIQRIDVTGARTTEFDRRVAVFNDGGWRPVADAPFDETISLLPPASIDPARAVVHQTDRGARIVDGARAFEIRDLTAVQVASGLSVSASDDPLDFATPVLAPALTGPGWIGAGDPVDELILSTSGSFWSRVEAGAEIRDPVLVMLAGDNAVVQARHADGTKLLRLIPLSGGDRREPTVAASAPEIRRRVLPLGAWSEPVLASADPAGPGFVGLFNERGDNKTSWSRNGLDIDLADDNDLPFGFVAAEFGSSGDGWWVIGAENIVETSLFFSFDMLTWSRVDLAAVSGGADEVDIIEFDRVGSANVMIADLTFYDAPDQNGRVGAHWFDQGESTIFAAEPCRPVGSDGDPRAEADDCAVLDVAVLDDTVYATHVVDQAAGFSSWTARDERGWQAIAVLDPPPVGGSVEAGDGNVWYLGDERVVVTSPGRERWASIAEAPDGAGDGRFVALSADASVAAYATETDVWVYKHTWNRYPLDGWSLERVLAVDGEAVIVAGSDDGGPIIARLAAPGP